MEAQLQHALDTSSACWPPTAAGSAYVWAHTSLGHTSAWHGTSREDAAAGLLSPKNQAGP